MKKTILISCLLAIIVAFPGCSCNIEPQDETEVEKQIGNELDPNFRGPTTPPYSAGPSGPPPIVN